jgi:hypothetical protein
MQHDVEDASKRNDGAKQERGLLHYAKEDAYALRDVGAAEDVIRKEREKNDSSGHTTQDDAGDKRDDPHRFSLLANCGRSGEV